MICDKMKLMGKTKNTKKKTQTRSRRPTKAELEKRQAVKRLIGKVLTVIIALFALFRLGVLGISLYNANRLLVGSLAPIAILLLIGYLLGYRWIKDREGLTSGTVTIFIGLLLIWQANLMGKPAFGGLSPFNVVWSQVWPDLTAFKVIHFAGGGLLGASIYYPVAFLFANIGTYIIASLLIVLGAFLASPWTVEDMGDFIRFYQEKWRQASEERAIRREEKARERAALEAERQAQAQAEAEAQAQFEAEEAARLAQLPVDPETGEILDGPTSLDEVPLPERLAEPAIVSHDEEAAPITPVSDSASDEDSDEAIDMDGLISDSQPVKAPVRQSHYRLPGINLFAPDKPKNQSREKSLVRQNIRTLEDTFKSFNIQATVERAEIGPSVTKYEIKPAVGVRVNRISNLADDLALALAAKDVRIEAPIPGKSLVGIEVPNAEVATVSYRELWEQSKTSPDNLLEIPLGKAVDGSVRSFDLGRMPHLLVAGSTGSGKSVAVNGIIASILMKARPDQVKFLMVDPKMVELSVYNDIPHLLIPVVTNPRKAARALQKVVNEMENRYELFSKYGVRNMAGYNAKIAAYNDKADDKMAPLPFIVVIVDELADLMMVASKEVEDAIIRLGQKARAAGIHMILATQRPSVDVISGLIKANVPSRIAFAVSSGTDSRTILDENGAEKLLGRGDMLFKPIDENHPIRLQGSFISDDDVEHIVDFIKSQAEADYDETFDPGEVSDNDATGSFSDSGEPEGDPLFEEAKALVIESQKASASMIQRRLSVGFNRATRLMEELEAAGVIGPAEGTKPRKVLQK